MRHLATFAPSALVVWLFHLQPALALESSRQPDAAAAAASTLDPSCSDTNAKCKFWAELGEVSGILRCGTHCTLEHFPIPMIFGLSLLSFES